MNPKTRLEVLNKYGSKCAYCGCELTNKTMQVDHLIPLDRDIWTKVPNKPENDNFDNLMPSCKYCNNYKHSFSLEEFRFYLKQMLNEKHEYLYKSMAKFQIAVNIGVITVKEWDGKFYFEKQEQ